MRDRFFVLSLEKEKRQSFVRAEQRARFMFPLFPLLSRWCVSGLLRTRTERLRGVRTRGSEDDGKRRLFSLSRSMVDCFSIFLTRRRARGSLAVAIRRGERLLAAASPRGTRGEPSGERTEEEKEVKARTCARRVRGLPKKKTNDCGGRHRSIATVNGAAFFPLIFCFCFFCSSKDSTFSLFLFLSLALPTILSLSLSERK